MIASAEALPLVSVVVPVYNVEPYLRECVESIRAQSYVNLEIILVDDGSTDGSGDMCDELAVLDGRITVLHARNGGPSAARNTGLKVAQGAYVAFIDSDDCVSPAFIETLYKALTQCHTNVAAVPGGCFFNDGEHYKLAQDVAAILETTVVKKINAADYLELFFYRKVNFGCHWWLFGRETLGCAPFSENILIGEDIQVSYRAVHSAGFVALADRRDLYAYRLRQTSLFKKPYEHVKGRSVIKYTAQLYEDICRWYPSLAEACAGSCFSSCYGIYKQTLAYGSEGCFESDRSDLWHELCKYRRMAALDGAAPRRRRLVAVIACLGEGPFKLYCEATLKFYKIKEYYQKQGN